MPRDSVSHYRHFVTEILQGLRDSLSCVYKNKHTFYNPLMVINPLMDLLRYIIEAFWLLMVKPLALGLFLFDLRCYHTKAIKINPNRKIFLNFVLNNSQWFMNAKE